MNKESHHISDGLKRTVQVENSTKLKERWSYLNKRFELTPLLSYLVVTHDFTCGVFRQPKTDESIEQMWNYYISAYEPSAKSSKIEDIFILCGICPICRIVPYGEYHTQNSFKCDKCGLQFTKKSFEDYTNPFHLKHLLPYLQRQSKSKKQTDNTLQLTLF